MHRNRLNQRKIR